MSAKVPSRLAGPLDLRRLPDWQARLGAYLHQVRERPFAWGAHDCALFVGAAVEAMTGADLLGELPPYDSASGAFRVLRGLGVASHEELAARLLPEVPPLLARPGDVALTAGARRGALAGALGVIQGEAVYVVAEGERGLGLVPRALVSRAFAVGP